LMVKSKQQKAVGCILFEENCSLLTTEIADACS